MNPTVMLTCTEVAPSDRRSGGSGDAGSGSGPLSAFRAKSAYVLLGDPGSGKATEFEKECIAMGDAAERVTARDATNGNQWQTTGHRYLSEDSMAQLNDPGATLTTAGTK